MIGLFLFWFVIRPMMLLAALVLELLLKSKLASEAGSITSKGKWSHTSHALLDLAQTTDVVLTSAEQDLVERLEAFLEWAGKYPVPLEPTKMAPRTEPSGGFGLLTTSKSSDRETWTRLVRRLRDE